MMRSLALLALFLLPLAACSDTPEPDSDLDATEVVALEDESMVAVPEPSDVPVSPEAPVAPDAPSAPDVPEALPEEYDEMAYRIVSAQSGDAACYLDLEPESGGLSEPYTAGFDVCDRIEDEGLTGRLVAITVESGEVMAGSCEGDPECMDTETVDLVTAITLAE